MQDFAFLFPDSAAAWLRGHGDGRFEQYERHYRSTRARASSPEAFDLEQSNLQFARRSDSHRSGVARIANGKTMGALASFLVFLWCGSFLLSTLGTSQPAIAGIGVCILFVVARVSRKRSGTRRS